MSITAKLPAVQKFVSNSGVRIYCVPCEAFPGFIANVYVLIGAGPPTLVDTGSGYGFSSEQLYEGFEKIRDEFNEPFELKDVKRIILTHGHIDHFGGLSSMVERADAEVCIHELDRRVLTAYEERVIVATKAVRVFLQLAGVKPEMQQSLLDMYSFSKQHVRSVAVDRTLDDGDELDGLRFIHTPGHCPGQVCILIGNVLLSADHILSKTTPHQAPESITAYTGLGHYLESLDRIKKVDGFELALGGHEDPIHDVYKRIDDIRESHEHKLDKMLDIIRKAEKPITVSEISKEMYSKLKGFNVLLAIEEVGAHVEYLYQRGRLAVTNLDEVEHEENPALRYETL